MSAARPSHNEFRLELDLPRTCRTGSRVSSQKGLAILQGFEIGLGVLANAKTLSGHHSLIRQVDACVGACAVCTEGRVDALKTDLEIISRIFDHLTITFKDFATKFGVMPRGWLAEVPKRPR